MKFKNLQIKEGWQQFSSIDIDFHPRLTVLTGANGAGKTTLLRFLGKHFGYNYASLLTPGIEKKGSGIIYRAKKLFKSLFTESKPSGPIQIGSISYSSDKTSALRAPIESKSASYQPTIDSPETIRGFFLPSHRPEFKYKRVDNISLQRRSWEEEGFQSIHNAIKSLSQGGRGEPVSFRMKEVLVGLGIFSSGGGALSPDYRAQELFEGFQKILRTVLPHDLGFDHLEIRDRSEIVLITKSGEFLLDGVSGGIASIFELAWLLYMYNEQDKGDFSVVIDEPENHLHPSMQRRLLPSFVEAFPQTQFIIATHSPFMVGSVRESNTYALRFSDETKFEDREVWATKLDFFETAGRAEEILNDVLGVDVTIPIWAENELNNIVSELADEDLTPELAKKLRKRISKAGLSQLLPNVLERLAKEEQGDKNK